jgi:hypothetical protein
MRDFLACAKIRPYPLPRPAAFLPAADEAESKVGIHCQPQRSGLFYKEKAFLSRLRRSANRRSFHCATPDFLSQAWWRWRTSCCLLYGKPHTQSSLMSRSRKSGFASVGMTKGRVVAFVWIGCWWREPQVPPLRYASVGMTRLGWLLSSGLDTGGGNRRSLHFATLRSG